MRKVCLILLVLLTGTLFSQPPYGSYHYLHTQSAKSFEKGRLELFTNMNFFTKSTDWLGQVSNPNFQAVNYWMVAGNMALTYGFTDFLDMTLGTRLYQDTHRSNEFNLPDDLFLNLKLGSFDISQRRLFGAFMLNFRFPTGEVHNYPFVEYASGAVEYGFKGAFSYFADPYLPERAFSAHLNLGWWNHNDAGKVLYEYSNGVQLNARKNASSMQYALGFVYPTAMFDFMLDVHGIAYIEQPDSAAYSRESWAYVTPGLRYKPLNWMNLVLGVDIRVSGDEYSTVGVPDAREQYDLPSYATWKIHLGANIKILPFTSARKTAAEIERDEFNKRVEFFQEIIEERERSEDVQEELDRLKEEREAAERELEELKQILEEEGN